MKHLDDINESYFEHWKHAMKFCVILLLLSVVCFVHAFFPFVFVDTASRKLKELISKMNREC